MDMIYRKILNDDKEMINSLYEEFLNFYSCNYGIGHGYPYWFYERIFCNNPTYMIFVATTSNMIVGYIMLERSEYYYFISALFVEEEYRHRGIARGLIEAASTYSKENGLDGIRAIARDYLLQYYGKMDFHVRKRLGNGKFSIEKKL